MTPNSGTLRIFSQPKISSFSRAALRFHLACLTKSWSETRHLSNTQRVINHCGRRLKTIWPPTGGSEPPAPFMARVSCICHSLVGSHSTDGFIFNCIRYTKFVTSDNRFWAIKMSVLMAPKFSLRVCYCFNERWGFGYSSSTLMGLQEDPPSKPRLGQFCFSRTFCCSSDEIKSRLGCSGSFPIQNFKFFRELAILKAQLFTRVSWKPGDSTSPLSVIGQIIS